MASYQFLERPNQVGDSSCSSNIRRHGFSKAQMCLQNILRIIASCPKEPSPSNPRIIDVEKNRGIGIDLNMGFGPWPEVEESQSQSFSACTVVDKVFNHVSPVEFNGVVFTVEKSSSEGECDPKEVGDQYGTDSPTIQAIGEESRIVGDRSLEVSETTNLQIQSHEIDEDSKVKDANKRQEEVENGDHAVKAMPSQAEKHIINDCFSLLIEAADLVSGNSESDSQKASHEDRGQAKHIIEETSLVEGGSKSSRPGVTDLCGDLDDMSPVVRTKRGRSQVLPSRYRDSILLEPWKRQPRPQRLAAAVSTKRKSR